MDQTKGFRYYWNHVLSYVENSTLIWIKRNLGITSLQKKIVWKILVKGTWLKKHWCIILNIQQNLNFPAQNITQGQPVCILWKTWSTFENDTELESHGVIMAATCKGDPGPLEHFEINWGQANPTSPIPTVFVMWYIFIMSGAKKVSLPMGNSDVTLTPTDGRWRWMLNQL